MHPKTLYKEIERLIYSTQSILKENRENIINLLEVSHVVFGVIQVITTQYMSMRSVDYIFCPKFHRRLIGKAERHLCVWKSEYVSVFEVTVSWICLSGCYILSGRVEIREVSHS